MMKKNRRSVLIGLLLLYPAMVVVTMLFADEAEISVQGDSFSQSGQPTLTGTGPGNGLRPNCGGYGMATGDPNTQVPSINTFTGQ